jgi:hypothetical protein
VLSVLQYGSNFEQYAPSVLKYTASVLFLFPVGERVEGRGESQKRRGFVKFGLVLYLPRFWAFPGVFIALRRYGNSSRFRGGSSNGYFLGLLACFAPDLLLPNGAFVWIMNKPAMPDCGFYGSCYINSI